MPYPRLHTSCLWLITCLLLCGTARAQDIFYGTNQYIEYQQGTVPIILTVPHGGAIQPTSIPDRTCNNAVNVTDINTIETALEIKKALFTKTGCYPHIVICHLKRTKLDCNRNLTDAACQQPEAELAWKEFHQFIVQARTTIQAGYSDQAMIFDIHGHGHAIPRIELGYLLDSDELAEPDAILNTPKYINYSSLRRLALTSASEATHAQLLRGNQALGTLLHDHGFPSVPSRQDPAPAPDDPYFSGGYITATHTCYTDTVLMNGVQMELNNAGIRNTAANRSRFAGAFAEAAITFLSTHFAINWQSCQPKTAIKETIVSHKEIRVYPNPIAPGDMLHVNTMSEDVVSFLLYTPGGTLIHSGTLDPCCRDIRMPDLPQGLYILKVTEIHGIHCDVYKIICL